MQYDLSGEEPLDLSDVSYLAMDWKNREKCRPYVLVQSKELVSSTAAVQLRDRKISRISAGDSASTLLDRPFKSSKNQLKGWNKIVFLVGLRGTREHEVHVSGR